MLDILVVTAASELEPVSSEFNKREAGRSVLSEMDCRGFIVNCLRFISRFASWRILSMSSFLNWPSLVSRLEVISSEP